MDNLPELIFASSDPVESRRIRLWLNQNFIRPLIPRVYTSNMADSPEVIVRRNVWQILSRLFPGSLVSHRTALEFAPSPGGNIYMTSSSRRVYVWPGITVRFAEGPKPLETDTVFYETLKVSSLERACLENLSPSREVDGERRTTGRGVIEARLLDVLNTRGEIELNKLRDQSRIVSRSLGMKEEFLILDQIIGALQSTKSVHGLASGRAKAQALGRPYDSARIELFQKLATELLTRVFKSYPEKTTEPTSFNNIAFYEAYFSNFIEGTTFLIDEARQIIYDDAVIKMRIADTHDIKGTYSICADRNEMNRIAGNPEELNYLLRSRHKILLSGRPEKSPGAFKTKINRAGNTIFVDPGFIHGTLAEGFKIYEELQDPVARALFMMFLISEVHPFEDGNGRIARLMMNAELVYAGYSKIIVPTVYREDYLLALRRLSRNHDPKVYIKTMVRALEFSHSLDPENIDELQLQLERANAFDEGEEGRLRE